MGTTNILDLNNRLSKVEKENVAQNSYTSLKNKPKINNVTLIGNKSLADIGAADAADLTTLAGDVGDKTQLNTTDKSSTVAAINEVNSKLNKTSSTISIDSAYNAGTDWNIVKQGNICVITMRNLKDIPAGNTVVGNIPVGFRTESGFYEYVYSANKNINIGVKIWESGDIQILNPTGSTISGTVNVDRNVTYFTA